MKQNEQLSAIKEIINQVSQMLRNKEPIKLASSIYMDCYNFLFSLQRNIVIIGDFFQSWCREYLMTFMLQELCRSKQFIDDFINELEIFKSLLHWLTKLFWHYEVNCGTRQYYIIELGLNNFDEIILKNKTIAEKWKLNYNEQLCQIRLEKGERDKLKEFQQILIYFQIAQGSRIEIQYNKEQQVMMIRERDKSHKVQNQQSPQSLFQTFLLNSLLTSTAQFYQSLSDEWIQNNSKIDYIIRVLKQIEIENDLKDNFYLGSQNEIFYIVLDQLINKKKSELVMAQQDGLNFLIDQMRTTNEFHGVLNLYKLMSLLETKISYSLSYLFDQYKVYIEQNTSTIFMEQQQQQYQQQKQQQVPLMLQHYNQVNSFFQFVDFLSNLNAKGFQSSEKARNVMELTLKSSLNQQEGIIKKIAFYSHRKFVEVKGGEDEIQRFKKYMKQAQLIIELLNNKAQFFQYYISHLKERIFKGEIRNMDLESEFIRELRKNHPEHIPSELIKMWDEYRQQRDQDLNIQQLLVQNNLIQTSQIQYTVFTLNSNLKEFNNVEQMANMPQEFEKLFSFYEKFYQEKYKTQKKLIWNLKIGVGIVNYRFDANFKSIFKLQLNTIQIIFLIVIKNNKNSIGIQELTSLSGFKKEEVVRLLQPLIDKKFIILSQDTLTLQTNQAQLGPIKQGIVLQMLPKKSAEEQNQEQLAREQLLLNLKERDQKIQLHTIRLMKSRKEMLFQDIIQGVSQNLCGYYSFTNRDIQRQVDELINNGYMTRDAMQNNKFHYTPG